MNLLMASSPPNGSSNSGEDLLWAEWTVKHPTTSPLPKMAFTWQNHIQRFWPSSSGFHDYKSFDWKKNMPNDHSSFPPSLVKTSNSTSDKVSEIIAHVPCRSSQNNGAGHRSAPRPDAIPNCLSIFSFPLISWRGHLRQPLGTLRDHRRHATGERQTASHTHQICKLFVIIVRYSVKTISGFVIDAKF